MRPVLITGGAPRVIVDAVRYLSVAASGRTAVHLRDRLIADDVKATCLLASNAVPDDASALRYTTRNDLDRELKSWINRHPHGVVVMTAAVNDYETASVVTINGEVQQDWPAGSKVPSRADEVVIRLKPAAKLIDGLRDWGHRGPLVACKYEATDSVLSAAEALRQRSKAAVVLANSLDGSIQALVDADGVHHAEDRQAVLAMLCQRIALLAHA